MSPGDYSNVADATYLGGHPANSAVTCNPKLKKILKNQVEVYKAANSTEKAIKVIMCFSESEHAKAARILNEPGSHWRSEHRHRRRRR